MKKIFSIISACLTSIIIVFLLVLCFVKKNINFDYNMPVLINVHNQSSSPTNNTGYTSSDAEFKKILKNLNNVTNLSLMDWLLGCNSISREVTQDVDSAFIKFNTDLKRTNIAVELEFEESQDVIVTIDGDTMVISFYWIIFIMPVTNEFTDIIVYFADNPDTASRNTAYSECRPILLKGKTKKFQSFVKSELV